ncbi:MAG TPA: DUF3572 domain-containing protein [Bosea sp. (in: a-proteobacteria)]|jgi:hypothetical protein|uniref:DUF3572 domain-containing protein n=1 Tax=Bosea sp. (in: a-proteobacteria) TaxID=1871050 RepID=UPI002E112704|nr:DUF3572 domain-containing protein [Bosea sp. (in: a-proteobacteria)]
MARLPSSQDANSQDAETLALRALGFLAAEPERLEPFLATTGLGPSTLRAAASDPGFLAAVLDHICGSDSLLLEFAANLGVSPERVALARERLSGPPPGELS